MNEIEQSLVDKFIANEDLSGAVLKALKIDVNKLLNKEIYTDRSNAEIGEDIKVRKLSKEYIEEAFCELSKSDEQERSPKKNEAR